MNIKQLDTVDQRRNTDIDKRQSIQYQFPYHYIPYYDNGKQARFSRSWGFCASYLAAMSLFEEWLSERNDSISKHIDIGCGDGSLINNISIKHTQIKFTGIDYDENAIRWAQQFGSKKDFSCLKLSEIPTNSYDSASLIEVLEHIPPKDLEEFLNEVQRILKPGGHVFITVPSDQKPMIAKHYQHFSKSQLRQHLSKLFNNISIYHFEKELWLSKVIKKILSNRFIYIELFYLNSYFIKELKKLHLNTGGRLMVRCQTIMDED